MILSCALSAAITFAAPDPTLPDLKLLRFMPSNEHVKEQLKFFNDFCNRYDSITLRWMVEAPWGNLYWEWLREARDTRFPVRSRQVCLGTIVHWLGWERFMRGDIPPAVPLVLIPTADDIITSPFR